MSRGSLDVIKEFLRSPDAQPRKNALTALGALQTEDSLRLLASIALSDPDESVRSRAEEELSDTPAAGAAAALKVIQDALVEPQLRDRAYRLLGRLRQRGWTGVRPAGGLLARLRRVNRFRSQYAATLTPLSWASLVGRALLGACLGMVSLLALIGFTAGGSPELWEVLAMVFFGWATAVLLLLVGIGRSAPVTTQPDRSAAVLLEVARALVSGLLAGIVVAFTVVAATRSQDTEWRALSGIVLAAVAVAVSVRTLGFVLLGLLDKPRWNRKAQAMLAAAGAIVVATSVLVAFGALDETSPASEVWVTLVVAAAALATAISSIDSEHGNSGIVSRRTARAFAAAIVALIIVPTIVVSLLSARARMAWGELQSAPTDRPPTVVSVQQTPGQPTIFSHDFDVLPVRFQFEVVGSPSTVLATIRAQRGYAPVLRIAGPEGESQPGTNSRSYADQPNFRRLDAFLKPGSYLLVAESRDSRGPAYSPYGDPRWRLRLVTVLPVVLAAVKQVLGMAGPQRYRLELQLQPSRSY